MQTGPGAGGRDGRHQFGMPCDVVIRVQARLTQFAETEAGIHAGELDNDQPGTTRRAGLNEGHELWRDKPLQVSQARRHRGHDDPVGQHQTGQTERAEKQRERSARIVHTTTLR